MQEQEVINNQINIEDVKKLIENIYDANYVKEHTSLINNIVIEASKENSKNPNIVFDDTDDGMLDDIQMFKNPEALKEAATRYFIQIGYARQIRDIIEDAFEQIAPINRDLAKYFITLQGTDNKEKLVNALKYIHAVQKRGEGIKLSDNKPEAEAKKIQDEYFSESREILDSLIDSFTKEKCTYNLEDASDLYDYFAHAAKSFIIGEFFDYDKAYVKKLKETDPKLFYNTRELATIYETMQSDQADDMAEAAGIYSKYGDLQMKGRKVICTIENVTNLLDPTTSVKRNKYTLLEAFAKASFTNAKESYLNLDMSCYGVHGKGNNLKYKKLFQDKSVDDLANILLNMDPSEEYDLENLDNNTYAMTAAHNVLNDYRGILEQTDLIKDIYSASGITAKKDSVNFIYNSIYVNDKSLMDLVEEHGGKNLDIDHTTALAAVIFAKAINDPLKVISLVSLKLNDNNVVTPSVITLEKNYDRLNERCAEHTGFEKFLHFFGVKYQEEKLLEQHQSFKAQFSFTKNRETILSTYEAKTEELFTKFNVELTLNNKTELESLNKAKNIEVLELNEDKKIEELDENLDKVSEKVAVKD